jgi:type IV pilus assembly protein PilW
MKRMTARPGARAHQSGLSLVELMVALVIGSVLIAGAFNVYLSSKKSYGDNEAVSRLQETARFAMSVIEADVREANFWGLLKGGQGIDNSSGSPTPQFAAAAPIANSAAMQLCGTNFGVDTTTPLQGDNNRYRLSLSNTKVGGCDTLADFSTGIAWATSPVVTADTITVRRASAIAETGPFPKAALAGRLIVCSNRQTGQLAVDSGAACPAAPQGQVNALVTDAYYVDRNSQQLAGYPSLHRKMLTAIGGVAQFRDQEVIAGVEDLQVQFGIDPAPGNTGVAQSYVDPEAVPAGAQIVAVRIWLMVRADAGEGNFTDNRIYTYGDRLPANGVTGDLNVAANAGLAYQPSLSADASFNGPRHTRHLLISRTIQVRNRLGP